ncbi:Coiled-coil domain-containing protein 96 [Frankliniella fusca]|uniref:Coiled-coil domain-containing protein 96 n=1 Tax=Frankliniella fusca TaxID=407009 RepID=A0AAE1L7Q0_9NEOP|nr:Coiled-coil domain-containing protein 96 [Frankliniella fusca]
MSVILEADEGTPRHDGSQTSATDADRAEDGPERDPEETSPKNSFEKDNIQQETSGENEDEQLPGEDSGGGGDTFQDAGENADEEENLKSLTSDREGSHTDKESKSVNSVSEVSKINTEIGSESLLQKDSTAINDQDQNASDENIPSGFGIVNGILEDLLDKVIQIKEEEIENEQLIARKLSSITTIKSVDEQGSIDIDAELQAQLVAEQEAAELKKKALHQENIQLYHSLVSSRTNLKRRNNFLIKQMYEHFKRKKIEHLFKEMPVANVDMEGKYVKALLAYEETQKGAMEEEIKLLKHVAGLEEKNNTIQSILEVEWNNLINKEREVTKGLLITSTTKHLAGKNIEDFIQRQTSKSKELARERLTFFKLRNAASADESHLKSLENLGDNLTLMEYEQLKMHSQSCVERLEERDADLHRLRSKATSAIHVLAEIREKTHTLIEDIETSKVHLHEINQELNRNRERVGCEKKRRDMSRSDTVRLRQEAGLLSEPKLLQDFKDSLSQKETLLKQLEDWKSKFESQKQNISALRKKQAMLQQKDEK